MGGSVSVSSKVGSGSTFKFTLPLSCPNLTENSMPFDLPEGYQGSGVIIADADPKHAMQLEKFLVYWGFKTNLVNSAQECLEMIKKSGKDAVKFVFVDQALEGEQHKIFFSKIPDISPGGKQTERVVMLSNKSVQATRKLLSEGISYYLFKPLLQLELLNLMQRILGLAPTQKSTDARIPDISKSGPKLNILVAEDQPINQRIIVQLLGKRGWEVTTANNGLEAMHKAHAQSFDLILMDVMMPEMDGFESTRLIRQDADGKNFRTPIIALTANAMKGDKEQCIAAGMNDYISKPINPEEVFQTLEKYYLK